jgi:hypothetical protein
VRPADRAHGFLARTFLRDDFCVRWSPTPSPRFSNYVQALRRRDEPLSRYHIIRAPTLRGFLTTLYPALHHSCKRGQDAGSRSFLLEQARGTRCGEIVLVSTFPQVGNAAGVDGLSDRSQSIRQGSGHRAPAGLMARRDAGSMASAPQADVAYEDLSSGWCCP